MDFILGIVIVILASQALRYFSRERKARMALKLSKNLINQLTLQVSELESLKKYEEITDVEAEVEKLKGDAKQEIKSLKEKSSDQRNAAIKKIEDMLQFATQQHDEILFQATQQAEEIAGDALDAKNNAKVYEKAVIAMKNSIDGYGDEYLIPNHSLLDELAEEFSHKEGGKKLKEARNYTKTLIKSDLAADCDYVEYRRRVNAIHFILDAFNGKVDTALAKVKHDNFGKLSQEIKDGFNLVNITGKVFRNAHITTTFLEARIDELKWAVTTNEIKLKEREEQRQIKEAMREEERARREYERVIKEAQKEEKMLQKAMTEARKHLEDANEEQRQKYEDQLKGLEKKLSQAEMKNERALSMAQQTRQGHVYVISNIGSFGEEIFKIGMTRRLEPLDRVKELGDASVPFGFDVHAMIHSEDAPSLEKELHHKFKLNQVNKVNSRKEFFNVRLIEIHETVEEMGISAHWTLAAEALEYRESNVISAHNALDIENEAREQLSA